MRASSNCCSCLRTIGRVILSLRRGEKPALHSQKSVGGCAQRCVVMKASPRPPLEVVETNFALHLLVVPFDPPA